MPFIKKVLIAFGLANFFATPTIIIIPLYTKVVLNKGATERGILEACLWIGLILGAFSARWFNFAKSITMLGGICIAVFGVALGLPGVFTSLPLYMVSLAVGGWCLGLNNVKFITLFQMEVPGHLKGRFFAIMQAMISFTFPMAYFTFGVLADVLPIQTVCLVQGIGLVAAGVVLAFFIKKPTSTSTDDQSCGLEAAEGGNSPTFGP